jgi:hypothetical protein
MFIDDYLFDHSISIGENEETLPIEHISTIKYDVVEKRIDSPHIIC